MRQLTIIALIFLLAACGSSTDGNEIPASLEGKRALLKEKKAELANLNQLISSLEDSIEILDPSTRAKALVSTMPIEKGDFSAFVKVQGQVEADELFDVTAEIGGRILRQNAKEGESVSRGQLIAVLDDEQIQKQIAELETSISLATTIYERQKNLWDKNIGSEIQFLEAKNNKERLDKNLELLKLQLNKTKVYAPATGIVDRVVLKSGELASPGVPIIQILNTRDLQVSIDLPENYLGTVKRGDRLEVFYPALSLEEKAPVSRIGSTIDPANRTFEVVIDIRNKDTRIKPNLLAEVRIQDFGEKEVVSIPVDQLQQEVGGKQYIFIVSQGEDGAVARKVYVETGRAYAGKIIITQGLQGGEQLITDGARGLADNTPLRISEPKKTETNG